MTHPAIESVTGERIGIPAHLLQGEKGQHFVLFVVGDSIAREGILDGDFLIILREQPRPGDIAVVTVGDDATIRRWMPAGEDVLLGPCAGDLKPIRVKAKDCTTLGVVVGLMRRFKRGRHESAS